MTTPSSPVTAEAPRRATSAKRPIDEIDQVIDCVMGAGGGVNDYDSDAASDSGRSLTSAPRSKRARGDILAPDGSVLRSGGSDVEDDSAYRAQLLQLVADATNSRACDPDAVGDLIDFHLTINQPAVFREMIESVSTLLDERLPLIIDSARAFAGVRISGMEKSKTCYVRAQFSCDRAYVSAGAVASHGGLERRIGGVAAVERMTRFHVATKVLKACLGAVPKTMSLWVVKSATRQEIVFGCHDGTSNKRQDTACVPTEHAETSDVATDGDDGGGDDDGSNDPTRWIVDIDCEHDALFSFNAELLRNAIAPAVAFSADEVTFSVKEPREQLRGGRPAAVRHAVLLVSITGTGSYSKPFYATGPWEDGQEQEAGVGASSSSAPHQTDSAASTPRSFTINADGEASMSAELESTLEQRYANIYDVKKMMGFLKGIRGTVHVALGRDMPISIAHGNTQYRVEMVQAPKNADATQAGPHA